MSDTKIAPLFFVSDWGNVMFTDESKFTLEPDDKRIRVRRKQKTRNQPQNITEHHAFRAGSIMVWAGISLGYRTDLHIFKRAYSPELNPNENLWDALGRAVSSRFPSPVTLIELETALQEEWRLLSSAVVDHRIEINEMMIKMLTGEDTVQNPRIAHREGLKAVKSSLQNFEPQGASVTDLLSIRRLRD
ncbi:transposable element Tcb1 transposase [Trichonephila clavipes]|nr:transposable element Tcb1 transposase [Trichonephila clavipes]